MKSKNISKCFYLILLLLSSFIIQNYTKTAVNLGKRTKFQLKLTKYKARSVNKAVVQSNSGVQLSNDNIIEFILGLLSNLPIFGGLASTIQKLLEENVHCKKDDLIQAYEDAVKVRQEKYLNFVSETKDQMDKINKYLPWRPINKVEYVKNLSSKNPKEACETIVNEKERQIKENQKYELAYDEALKAAIYIKYNKISPITFKNALPKTGYLNTDKEKMFRNLKHFFKRFLFEAENQSSIDEFITHVLTSKISWEETIDNTIMILSDNQKMAEQNQEELKANENPNCSKMPDNELYEKNKSTILDKLAGGWAALKYLKKCYEDNEKEKPVQTKAQKFVNFFLILAKGVMQKLVVIFGNMIANIFGMFALKALKMLWQLAKTLHFIYLAIEAKDEAKKHPYKFWGQAAGGAIRLLYIAFNPAERKK